jgi:hypothetical protein
LIVVDHEHSPREDLDVHQLPSLLSHTQKGGYSPEQ